jgi:hypothetical protein
MAARDPTVINERDSWSTDCGDEHRAIYKDTQYTAETLATL